MKTATASNTLPNRDATQLGQSPMHRVLKLVPTLFLIGLFASPIRAQDRVTLQTKNGDGRVTLRCEILDFKSGQLSLRLKAGLPTRNYPASEIVKIETWRSDFHDQALKLLREQKFPQAQEKFERALDNETRIWMRRNLLALLTEASLNAGDVIAAGNYFSILTTSDPDTHHYDMAPLAWTKSRLPFALKQEARRWMLSEQQGAQLLGSSHLLFDAENQKTAESTLRRLGASINENVRALAKAQLWRPRIERGVQSKEVEHWERDVSRMPKLVQGGPYFMLGLGWNSAGNSVRAAESFLRLPVVYPRHRTLAAEAEWQAAQALISIGQYEDGITLLSEIVERFAETPASQKGLAELKRLAGNPQTSTPIEKPGGKE